MGDKDDGQVGAGGRSASVARLCQMGHALVYGGTIINTPASGLGRASRVVKRFKIASTNDDDDAGDGGEATTAQDNATQHSTTQHSTTQHNNDRVIRWEL